MNRKVAYLLVLLICSFSASTQVFKIPTEGRSLIYFTRTSGTGALINFKYFDGEKYLGKFSGVNYMIYECDPGEHTFWVSAENRDFVSANLLPGKTYLMEVRPTMGAFKAAVKLFPLSATNEKDVKKVAKIKKLIAKKDPILFDNSKVNAEAKELDFFIENGIKKYNKDLKAGIEIKKMTESMFHN